MPARAMLASSVEGVGDGWMKCSAHGRDPGDEETMDALRRLRDEAGRDGLRSALPALDRALAGE